MQRREPRAPGALSTSPAAMRRLAFLVALASIVPGARELSAQPAAGGGHTVRPTISGGGPGDGPSGLGDAELTSRDGRIELTLDDAVALGLESNLELLIQRYQHTQTLLGVGEALAIFDLDLSAGAGFNEDSREVTSALVDSESETLINDSFNLDVSLSQLVSTGGRAGLSFNNSRGSSSDRNDLFNPSFSSNLSLSFSQPLLRGFGRRLTRQGITVAHNQNEISHEEFQLRVEGLVQQISDAYWAAAEARNQLRVAEESVGLARELHDMNIQREEAGVVAPLEVTRSEADLAAREEEIIERQARVEDTSDTLRGLLDLDRGPLWNQEIVPVTDPVFEPLVIDVDEAVETALAERPEMRRRRIELENLALSARSARDSARPDLSLDARWNSRATEGTTRVFADEDDTVGMLVENDFFDALDTLLSRDFEGWSLSLRLNVPVQNRQAAAEKARAELALERGELELRALEQSILIEVRQSARAVKTAARQIESARRSSELAQKTLEVEELSYRSGQSSGFEILQSQERLREARSREVGAVTNYRRALTAFFRSTGRLLEEKGIELAGDG